MGIVTISREYGSGGREIGQRLAEKLTYRFVDKKQLFEDLEKAGSRWGRVARELDEVCPTFWERYDWQYRGYVARVESLLFDYAVGDRVVIIGRGGSMLLRDVSYCLRVRLVAPLPLRIERIMVRESLNAAAAERLIAQVDSDRACFLKANYGVDWEEDRWYDVILDTGNLGYEQVVNILAKALAEKEPLATADARAALRDLALAYRLKARIATDPRVLVPTLEVNCAEGVITVSGIVHNPKEVSLIREMAAEVCADQTVRFDLHHRV